jgi:hypothetical protein
MSGTNQQRLKDFITQGFYYRFTLFTLHNANSKQETFLTIYIAATIELYLLQKICNVP